MRALLVWLACTSLAIAGPTPSVAVLGLEVKSKGGDIDKSSVATARALTDGLRRAARSGKPYRLAAGSTDKDLVDVKLLAGCDDEGPNGPACLGQIGTDLAADFLVYGNVTQRGATLDAHVLLFDVSARSQVRGVVRSLAIRAPVAEELGRSMYEELVGQSGQLQVRSSLVDGVVVIDGEERGQLRDGQLLVDVAPGSHQVVVKDVSTGRELARSVEVVGGSIASEEFTFKSASARGPVRRGNKTWKTVAIASGVVAAGAAAGLMYSYSQIDDAERGLCSGRHKNEAGCVPVSEPRSAELRDQGEFHSTMSYVEGAVFGVASAALVVGIWKGFVAKEAAPATASRRRTVAQRLAVVPTISPDGLGTTLRFEF